jgi:hypothetical protein
MRLTTITLEKMYPRPGVFYAFHAFDFLILESSLEFTIERDQLTDLCQPSRVLKQHLSH